MQEVASTAAIGFPNGSFAVVHGNGNMRAHQGRWDNARAAFHEARTMCRSGGAVFFEAMALHDCGLMEALAGNRAAARARFEEELTLLQVMGATSLITRTEQELARLR